MKWKKNRGTEESYKNGLLKNSLIFPRVPTPQYLKTKYTNCNKISFYFLFAFQKSRSTFSVEQFGKKERRRSERNKKWKNEMSILVKVPFFQKLQTKSNFIFIFESLFCRIQPQSLGLVASYFHFQWEFFKLNNNRFEWKFSFVLFYISSLSLLFNNFFPSLFI